MRNPIRVHIWGDYALFCRPELKSERYSYDVITPSAARGILDAIYYHPGLIWRIDKIYVQKPIRFMNIRRNEVSQKISCSNLLEVVNGSTKALYIDRAESIAQRAATILRDVSYVIEAHFDIIPEKMSENDSEDKFYAIFMKRLKKGRYFTQPYFGNREFTAMFSEYTSDDIPATISEDRDLGLMLYDLNYSDPQNIHPLFFRANMQNGVIDVADCEVIG